MPTGRFPGTILAGCPPGGVSGLLSIPEPYSHWPHPKAGHVGVSPAERVGYPRCGRGSTWQVSRTELAVVMRMRWEWGYSYLCDLEQIHLALILLYKMCSNGAHITELRGLNKMHLKPLAEHPPQDKCYIMKAVRLSHAHTFFRRKPAPPSHHPPKDKALSTLSQPPLASSPGLPISQDTHSTSSRWGPSRSRSMRTSAS
jgi:hypothetical protein